MYKRYPIGSCKTETGDGSVFLYKYYLTQTQKHIYRDSSYAEITAYGIEAACEKVSGDCITTVHTDVIECISPNKEKVLGLIDFLRKHEVSPIHLIDIAGSFVDDCIENFEDEAELLMKTAASL